MTTQIKYLSSLKFQIKPSRAISSKVFPTITQKLKTQPQLSRSAILSKTIFNRFPHQLNNPELKAKKSSLKYLFQNKKEFDLQKELLYKKKIIPHPVSMNHTFTKKSGPKMKQKVLNQQNKILVTAKKWLIYDIKKDQIIKGYKYKKPHDIASISKLMTFFTVYKIVKQFYLGIDKIDLICQKQDAQILGTKINLQQDNIITIQQALYALLLVSANNAGTVLANNLGHLVKTKREGKYFSCFDIKQQDRYKNIQQFVKIMNFYSKQLLLDQTFYENPHGMCKNISNCKSVAILFKQCWKIPLFQKIMLQKQKIIHVKLIQDQGTFLKKPLLLKNSNQLLWTSKHCFGGKTGTNYAGGDSFVAIYDEKYIFVVLGSCGKEQKFHDCQRLYQWIKQTQNEKQLQIIEKKSPQKQKNAFTNSTHFQSAQQIKKFKLKNFSLEKQKKKHWK